MRRYATGLQLVLLVCAGAASGYLWRAALDPRSAVAPSFVRAPDPTWLFVKPRATSGGQQTPSPLRVQAQAKRSVHPRTPAKRGSPAVKRHILRHEPHTRAELASLTAPKQTLPESQPAQPQTRSKRHKPLAPPPRSKKSKPPATRRPVPPPVSPTPSPPQPSRPAIPATPVPPAVSSPSARPGWGKGDQNHDHTGPPGQSGKGNSKK
jgi:hypothetical protein